jgi:hypothetical protein
MLMLWIYCKESTETLIGGSKERIKYMLLSYHQNVGQNHDTSIKTVNKSFQNVAKSKCLENYIKKSKFDIGGKLRGDWTLVMITIIHFRAFWNIKIRIYKTIIFPVMWVWNLVSKSKGGTWIKGVYQGGRIFEPMSDEVTGSWRKLHNEELHKLYSLASMIRMIKSWGREECI